MVEFLVALAVPLSAVEDRPDPCSRSCEEVVEEVELATTTPVLYAKIVVEPKVVVLVEDPLLIVETIADVEIAEETVVVGRVFVNEYEM